METKREWMVRERFVSVLVCMGEKKKKSNLVIDIRTIYKAVRISKVNREKVRSKAKDVGCIEIVYPFSVKSEGKVKRREKNLTVDI